MSEIPLPRVLRGSQGGGRFLVSKVPLLTLFSSDPCALAWQGGKME